MSKLSDRQLITVRDFGNVFKRLHVGPMGCGKTYSASMAFGMKLMSTTPGKLGYAIIGRTLGTVRENIIKELKNMYGSNIEFTNNNSEGKVFGHSVKLIGLNDCTAEARIRGLSVRGILGDELSTWSEEQFQLIIARLRGEIDEGIFWFEGATNPDNPKHWLKNLIDKGDFDSVIQWTENDAAWNGCLEYYRKLKKQYKNCVAFYKRYVKGLWSASEGMVYSMFNPNIHLMNADIDLTQMRDVHIGIDWGTTNPTAIVAIARAHSGQFIVFKNIKLEQKTTSEIARELCKLIDEIKRLGGDLKGIYIDPSASSLKLEITKSKVKNVFNAINDVVQGIGHVSSLFSDDNLIILDECNEVLDEIYAYAWKNGTVKDEVVKKFDHFMDAIRYVLYTLSKTGG